MTAAHFNLGIALFAAGQIDQAIKAYKDAIRTDMTFGAAYVNLGICSRKAGLMREADGNLQRALILRPGMPEALYALAELSLETGDYAGAKSYFLKFSQRMSELNAEQLWLAIRIERKMRDRNSAASYALQLRKRFPDSREAQLLSQGE